MIRVNLLPPEYRVKETRKGQARYLKIALGAAAVFGIVTVYGLIDFILTWAKLGKMEREWQKSQPAFQQLTQLKKEVEGDLKKERQFMEQFVTTTRPLTQILMWVSEFLPDSAWLVELQLSRIKESGVLLVKGLSLPSKDKTSIEQIEKYLQSLKAKMPDAKLTLTTTRQETAGVELTQFTANFKWGADEVK